jgi:hypothetical protein
MVRLGLHADIAFAALDLDDGIAILDDLVQ